MKKRAPLWWLSAVSPKPTASINPRRTRFPRSRPLPRRRRLIPCRPFRRKKTSRQTTPSSLSWTPIWCPVRPEVRFHLLPLTGNDEPDPSLRIGKAVKRLNTDVDVTQTMTTTSPVHPSKTFTEPDRCRKRHDERRWFEFVFLLASFFHYPLPLRPLNSLWLHFIFSFILYVPYFMNYNELHRNFFQPAFTNGRVSDVVAPWPKGLVLSACVHNISCD